MRVGWGLDADLMEFQVKILELSRLQQKSLLEDMKVFFIMIAKYHLHA